MKKLSKLLLALSFVLSITTSAFAVTVVSWGGAYTESQKLGYGDPTAAKLGIPVNSFVAEFIGENNTFGGEVIDVSGDKCKVKLNSGAEIFANPIVAKAKGEKTTVSLRPERALIDPQTTMDNNHKGKIEEVIYHGDHTRLRVDLLGNKQFILKVPNSSSGMDIKAGKEINIGWNSIDCRALDPK